MVRLEAHICPVKTLFVARLSNDMLFILLLCDVCERRTSSNKFEERLKILWVTVSVSPQIVHWASKSKHVINTPPNCPPTGQFVYCHKEMLVWDSHSNNLTSYNRPSLRFNELKLLRTVNSRLYAVCLFSFFSFLALMSDWAVEIPTHILSTYRSHLCNFMSYFQSNVLSFRIWILNRTSI